MSLDKKESETQEKAPLLATDEAKSHDKVLTEAGGFSWLQFRACMILIPAKVSGDLIVNIAAFYQLMPKYECQAADGSWQECNQSDFCTNMGAEAGVIHREDLENPETLQNWVQKLDMECSEKAAFGFLGTMIFTGWTIAAFFVPRISDLYGRKWTFIVNISVQFLAILAMISAKSYTVIAIALFFVGVCSSARWTVSYVYLMEFLTEEKIKCIGPFVNASAALAFTFGAFTLQFLTKETVYLEYAAAVLSIVCVVLTGFFLPESAKWLVGQGAMERAATSYAYIAQVNGKNEFAEQVHHMEFKQQTITQNESSDDYIDAAVLKSEDDQSQQPRTYQGRMWELWHYTTLRWNLLVLIVCWCSCSFGFYMLAYVLKYLNGNIFFNAYSSSAGEIIGKLSTIWLLKCLSLRRVFLVAFGLSSIGMLLLVIFFQAEKWIPLILMLARFGFSQAFVASYLSIVLVYPTILTSSTVGICVTFSKIATIFAPMVAEVRSPINLVILLIIAIVASLTSQLLIVDKQQSKSKA